MARFNPFCGLCDETMNATWALDRHLARGIIRLLQRRYGALPAWQLIRLLWLSGAIDGREVGLRHMRAGGLKMLASGHCLIDPWSDHSMERLVRTWPGLVELCRQRQG